MRMKQIFFVFLSILALSACSTFEPAVDTEATITAQFTSVADEGTAISAMLQAQSTEVAQTAVAAETYIIQMESINQQLLATMRAIVPPTQQIVSTTVSLIPEWNPPAIGSDAFVQAGTNVPPVIPNNDGNQPVNTSYTMISTASDVNAADSCPRDNRVQFTPNDSRIYVTARAFNIRAGTVLNAAWSYNGAVVYDADSFTIEVDDTDYCLYFYVDQNDVTFSLGGWSVQLIANGIPITPAASFTIVQP